MLAYENSPKLSNRQYTSAWNEQGYAIKTEADTLNSYKMYLIKCSNKFI
jgi:hypothetical protein